MAANPANGNHSAKNGGFVFTGNRKAPIYKGFAIQSPMEPQPDTPDLPPPEDVAWTTLVLVCRDCFERPDGPACGGSAGTAKARIKEALRDLKPRVRTLESSCHDCCPEKAFSVAIVRPDAPPAGFALTSVDQADAVVRAVRNFPPATLP